MTPSNLDSCIESIHVLPSSVHKDGELSEEFLTHRLSCKECQSLQSDFDLVGKALLKLEVPEPCPTRWSNLPADVLSEIALQQSTEACPDFEADIVSDSGEKLISPDLEKHLADCENCQTRMNEVKALQKLLDLAPIPRPSPERWNGLKDSVLASVQSKKPQSNLQPIRFPSFLMKCAAAFLLIFTGAFVATLWPSAAVSQKQLAEIRLDANTALEQHKWEEAERLLQKIIKDGSSSEESHELVTESHDDLKALWRFIKLPSNAKSREQGLAKIIYDFPASRVTAKAIAEYTHLKSLKKRPSKAQGPRKGIENFDPMPQPDPQLALAFNKIPALKGTKAFQAILIRSKEPWLKDAARVQLALLKLRSNDFDAARLELEKVQGRSPASRFAQRELERLSEN
ncbi:MAG: hypothetical protein P1V97_18065 [Planctomycetota bacterium]|nr:hypothetical protein [Planctomycetota bacterium]